METLLDMDRIPTVEEMKAFFKKNDWTGVKLSNEDKPQEVLEKIEKNKAVLSPFLEAAMREHGLGVPSKYYNNTVKTQDAMYQQNPLIAFGENFNNTVSTLVEKWQRESSETAQQTIEQVRAAGIDEAKLLSYVTGLSLTVTGFDKAAEVVRQNSADEDFNPRIKNNYRAMDHKRKWNHTRAKVEEEFCADPELINNRLNPIVNPEHEAMFNLMLEEYINALDDTDRKIFYWRVQGLSQEEIAVHLGYTNNGAVSKRLEKMRRLFKKITGY